MSAELMWPPYARPADLAAIEALPLKARGLPGTTYAVLARAAELWPDRVAVSVLPDGSRWDAPAERTFAQLLADVHRYANLLHRLGVRRTDAVALIAPNCLELITATLAAQLAGIAAPLNGALSPQHLGALLRTSGARVLITADADLDPSIWAVAPGLEEQLDAVLALRPTAATGFARPLGRVGEGVTGYLAELAESEDADAFVGAPPAPVDLAAFFHTGGTTGIPKLAAHTHEAEVANAWMIAANSLADESSTVLAALPLFHVNAFMVTLLAPLLKGQQVVWAGPLGYRDPALFQNFWRIVEHYRLATMSAVPTVYATLAQLPLDADISSLRFAMVGSSPLPPAVRQAFEARTGVTLLEGYGLTETTCASARSFPSAPHPGSVGQRMPYQRIKAMRGDTWEELPAGQTGVLAVAGPTVFAGYVVARDENGPVLRRHGVSAGGWLDTGDLGHVDSDGFVYLSGRVKDLIIRGGHNIDPAVIEDALLSHPQVTAASAVGRPDAHSGEVPVAYVTLAPSAAVTEQELLAWADAHVTERAAAPKAVTVLQALPVTAVGKPYKLPLRADAARSALTDALAVHGPGITVDAAVADGVVTVTVVVGPEHEQAAVKATLDRFAIDCELKERV